PELVIRIYQRQGRYLRIRIGLGPGIQYPRRMVKSVLNPYVVKIAIALPSIIYRIACNTLPEHIEVEIFIIGREGYSVFDFGIPAADPGPVIIIIDIPIGLPIRPGEIFVTYPAQTLARLSSGVVHLVVAGKDPVCNKSIVRVERMSLDIISLQGAASIRILHGLGQVGDLVLVM